MGGHRSGRDETLGARVERTVSRCARWSREGRHRKVVLEIERILPLLAEHPHLEAQLLLWKAQALLSMGTPERAVETASRSWQLEGSPHACYLMAEALTQLGQLEEAEELLELGRSLFPDATHLSLELAMLLADQGRVPEALDVLEELEPAEEEPLDVQIFRVGLQANLLASAGRWSEAEQLLDDGLALHPDSELLARTQDSIQRERQRRRAEVRLTESWKRTTPPLEGSADEVDEELMHLALCAEEGQLRTLAARRLWRAFLGAEAVRPAAPGAWAAALLSAARELDGLPPDTTGLARLAGASLSTTRNALGRIRGFLESLEPEFALRSFAVDRNPRLAEEGDPDPRGTTRSNVIDFPVPPPREP